MRRTASPLVATALLVATAGGAALAAPITCSSGADSCVGTEKSDTLYGTDQNDRMIGLGRGDDDIGGYARNYWIYDEGPRGILGGPGNDYVSSRGTTNDTIYVSDGERDTVGCGEGADTVYYDKGTDRFVDNSGCENRIPR